MAKKSAKKQVATKSKGPKATKAPVLAAAKPFAANLVKVFDLITSLRAEMDALQGTGDAIAYARGYVVLHSLDDKIETFVKQWNGLYETIKKERLPGVFEGAGTTTVNLDEGFRVTVSSNIRASIREGQKEAAFGWLRDNDLGDLITETVNASTLSATAKSLLEGDIPKELDTAIFNVAIMPNTSVTKTKAKS